MKKVLSAREMKECDSVAIENGILSGCDGMMFMERAADALFDFARESFDVSRTLVFSCGGNNGGDGLLCAERLALSGASCTCVFLGDENNCTKETKSALKRAEGCGVRIVRDIPAEPWDCTLIIDAMLGIGLKRELSRELSEVVHRINESGIPVLSVDIPTGVCADTGKIMGDCVLADATLTVQAYKYGLLMGDGVNAAGKVFCRDIGISTDNCRSAPTVLEEFDLSMIPRRKRNSNKGDYLRVLCVGGSPGMCGAAYYSALAAYRSGAGIVEILTPRENREILQALLPEAIVTVYDGNDPEEDVVLSAMERAGCIIVGPGLSKSEGARRVLKFVYKNIKVPLVVDADALNITAEEGLTFPKSVPVTVTPHPGEMARLTGKSISELAADPVGEAVAYAEKNGVICVLKFAKTVITDGKTVYYNVSGGPALAKGGSGDVLTGIIAGMYCCKLSPLHAAAMGAYVHGAAADEAERLMGEISPMARDITDCIGRVLQKRN